jgi:UDP-N-acetyl-D-mannosaminuronic acid dehydrogenase
VSKASKSKHDVCIVGGAGHVGLPLALVLADRGFHTLILDTNKAAMEVLASGRLPFLEDGGEELLKKILASGRLHFSSDPKNIAHAAEADFVVLTIGTPIDEFHNPNLSLLTRCLDGLLPHLRDDQTIIVRSTVAPGTTSFIDSYIRRHGRKIRLAFCPERVVQGKGIKEIRALPQLVSGTSPEAVAAAKSIFSRIAPEVVEMTPLEAEFAKLICNAFRYIQFAATNQLYMMVESAGLNYNDLLAKMKRGYSRLEGIPGPGFAAGPCLMKDTMQLFAFQKHNFILGQVAMTINEGLPNFIVETLAAKFDLAKTRVGILGMAFKAESDDIRDSLSYKLGKLLRYHRTEVFYSDEYVKDPTFVCKETLVRECDVIIVGVPHTAYRSLQIPASKHVVDLWSVVLRNGGAAV